MGMRAKRWRAIGGAVLGALLLAGPLQAPAPARAVSATDFDPGNIVSDELFYDGTAMTAPDVQSFLNERVPRCTIGDPGRTPGTAWGNSRIASACLRDFRMTTATRTANAYCAAYAGAANESAAQIIARVGRACGISPKVLLVMLEKEQSLVADTWPTVRQFDAAMGYACPDSGPGNSANCDASYFGFFNQVYRAAWQLKVYRAHPTNYRYQPFTTNTIQWHPNAGCGTSQVVIENWATAALYIYTPYRPNAAALAAGWGTGDACSSYGNRNFFLMYSNWFGPTRSLGHASLDSVSGEYRGIRLTGWARKLADPDRTGAAYVWANVYDEAGTLVTSGAFPANRPLSWFDAKFPGWGPNHGFDARVDVAPGTYRVKVYNSSVNSELIATRSVTVPLGAGHVDAAAQTVGGIRLTGWSVDFRTPAADTLRVVLDGRQVPQTFRADRATSWIDAMFPGMGGAHGFDLTVPATLGAHTVCVYGAVGLISPCSNVTLGNSEHGSVDTVTATPEGARVTGWAVNLASADPSGVIVTVNGSRTRVLADRPLSWFDGYLPGAGPRHGFEAVVPLPRSGSYEFCIVGEKTGVRLSCRTESVLVGEGASFDSATGVTGGIRITGWAARFGNPDPSYIWVNVDGSGGLHRAALPLSWFDRYSPGSGANHGFDTTLPASPGRHEVCVFAALTATPAGCRSVVVPAPAEQGHLDGVSGGAGSIRAWGWSHVAGQPTPSYVWIDVDGSGSPHRANVPLSWFDAFAPGQGPAHGFDGTIPASPGAHRVCVSGMGGPTAYGCRTVTVQ